MRNNQIGFVKVAAIFFLILFATMVIRFILFGGTESIAFEQLDFVDRLILISGVIGAFGFWFSMLADFFTNTALKGKVVWGFCLILFSWLSALVYFFMHFLPRHRQKQG